MQLRLQVCSRAQRSTACTTTRTGLQRSRGGGTLPARNAAAAAPAAAAVVEPHTGPLGSGRQDQPQQQQQQQQSILQQQLPYGLQPKQMPRHVAIIMDGNSRWAARRGLPAFVGHERGVAALRSAVITARQWGIAALTVFAFSVENWQRDGDEVAFLMDLFSSSLQQQLPELQANGVALSFMGQLHRLPPGLQQQVAACEAATAGNTGLRLCVAVSYGGQQDVAQAVQQLARQVAAGQLAPEQITPDLISRHLSSGAITAQVGPPDLIIRTSGEQRLSNFMLLEAAYAELCFVDALWPDFGEQLFATAVHEFAQRQRRYGSRQQQQPAAAAAAATAATAAAAARVRPQQLAD